MNRPLQFLLALGAWLFSVSAHVLTGQSAPENVTFKSGSLTLHGSVWKPSGAGPFAAVLYNHGSERTVDHLAVVMMVVGAVIGTSAMLEFAYFGPGTPQFIVGLFTTPAAFVFLAAGVHLWRRGVQARWVVASAALMLLLATVGAAALAVMGPAAILVSVVGIACCGIWLVLGPRSHRRPI